MATSGTVTFRLDVEQIITEAYERCGIDAQTRTGYQAVSARRSLNLLFSEWANRGINYWTLQNNTVSLVDGQIQYTLPAGTIDLSYLTKLTRASQVSTCSISNTRQSCIFGRCLIAVRHIVLFTGQ